MIFDANAEFDLLIEKEGSDYTNTTFYSNAAAFAKRWSYDIDTLTIKKTMTSRLWNNRQMTFGELIASSDYCNQALKFFFLLEDLKVDLLPHNIIDPVKANEQRISSIEEAMGPIVFDTSRKTAYFSDSKKFIDS